jgi:peptidoglycan DL-endopeptidase CwlO
VFDARARIARRIAAGATISALAVTLGVQSVSHAEPSIEEAQTRVDKLYHEAEVAQERLNDIQHTMQGKQERLTSLQRDLRSQRAEVEEMGEVVATTVAREAQSGGGFGPARLLTSDDPEQVLNGIVASESFSQHQGEMLREFATKSDQLELRKQEVEAEVAELESDKKQIAEENERVESKLAEAKDVLAELEAEERERLRRQREAAAREAAAEAAAQARREAAQEEESSSDAQSQDSARPSGPTTSRSAEREPVSAPASSGGAAAVEFARAQVGDAYVYGANGPDAWDCSGLTTAAWAAAGVSLPRSSSAQMGAGTPVSRDQLQPGDLVFYYSPVSHVGIYAGNGQLIHAANPSTGVQVTSVDSMPYSGAVRPG